MPVASQVSSIVTSAGEIDIARTSGCPAASRSGLPPLVTMQAAVNTDA
jgi:hypothetical protein